jgi:membrane complex biogenesis BtpA family protein
VVHQKFSLRKLFPVDRPLIGVVHLLPLPGSPRFGGSMDQVVERAKRDARAYATNGLDGLILENYGDLPFYSERVPPETIAAMALVAAQVHESISIAMGFNVLRNDSLSSLGLAAVFNASFIRVNILLGALVTDQGIVQGRAPHLLRRRNDLGLSTRIFADVMVKHAGPLTPQDVKLAAKELVDRGLADALIVTGKATGAEPLLAELRSVKEAVGDVPVLAGSGVTPENVKEMLTVADGAIVGTSLKKDGQTENEVDAERVKALLKNVGR